MSRFSELFSVGGFVFIKNILVFVNFLAMLGGVLMMAYGIQILYSRGDMFLMGSVATTGIILGVLTAFVSFLGCCGATNEKGILLKIYFALLMVLVVLQIVAGSVAAATKVSSLSDNVWTTMYNKNDSSILSVEYRFQCCGFTSVTDRAVPSNCVSELGFTVSCYNTIMYTLKSNVGSLAAAALTLGLVQLMGLIFSFIMFRKMAAREGDAKAFLSEAWRINTNRIQHGYAHYQQQF